MSDVLERLQTALTDRYATDREVGRGGMATVFMAEDLKHRRKVAIKVLHPELASTVGVERFLREIEIAAGLDHPHILSLLDSGQADGLLYYVMPFVKGESLRSRLEREKQLPIEEAVHIAREVADGLGYAHRQGVVHRDIKPGNIMLSEGHALIADFGVARAVGGEGQALTSTGLAVGTPTYMSPEQASGEAVDARSDMYALGCVLYEMLAGEPPLTGATPQMIQARRLSETPTALHTLRDTVPPALDGVIARALARVPADRWNTTVEFGAALESASSRATSPGHTDPGNLSAPGRDPPSVAPVRTPRETTRGLLVASLALVAAIAGYFLLGRPEDPELPRVPTAAERMEARQLYLRGDASWESAYGGTDLDRETRTQLLLQAAGQFDSATQLDPQSADGWAGLATVFAYMGFQRYLPADSAFPLVLEPAQRAIALDSTSARAYEALALKYRGFDQQWQASYDAMMTAARLEPGNPDVSKWRAWAAAIQTNLGRPDSALATIRPALEDTTYLVPRLNYLLGLQYSRDYEAALAEARRLIEEDAGYLRDARHYFWEVALQALIELGRMEEAAEMAASLPDGVVFPSWCLQAQYFARAGNREGALACFDELREAGVEPWPRAEAIVHGWLGDLDRAFEILDLEFEATGFVGYLPSDPAFDPLREDPRFDMLLARMGLECRYYADGHDCFQR